MKAPGIASYKVTKLAVYDGALRYMDDQLAKLFTLLGQRGLLDDTMVVITADHGEEFWEHGVAETELYDCSVRPHTGVGHGQNQFQELLSVPLIIAGPGIKQGVVQERVSLLDVPATIFDVAVGDRSYEFGHSRSLGPRLRGEAPPAAMCCPRRRRSGGS
jgi:arylsulfatase A-like enzyme